jgi:3-methyl-2-oxobutanoate hydroxymethyltransferase
VVVVLLHGCIDADVPSLSAVLTAYDYPSALAIRGAPVDICLVGDSLANVALGLRTTQQLPLEAMIHHLQAVSRGLRHVAFNQPGISPVPLLIADLPYGIAQLSIEHAVEAATALVQQGGADGVKIEGSDEILPLVRRLTSFGMPVMAHVGLQPQRASSGSAFQLQGRSASAAFDILQSALLLEEAGAFSAVLECIPNRVGAEVSKRLEMATIGIGGGQGCDGQVLVQDDIMGECTSPLHVLANLQQRDQAGKEEPGAMQAASSPYTIPPVSWPNAPRFVRGFARQVAGGSSIGMIRLAAVQAYVQAVKSRSFPTEEEGYKMKKEEWAAFKAILDDFDKGDSF